MKRIKLIKGDITKLAVDVIVNAANSSLLGGGGVDGAIHRAGGKAILDDCIKIRNRQGGCKTGEAVITTAGKLPAKHVIHTVGPVWDSSKKEKMKTLLANCYRNSLQLAVDNHLATIAFPNISTGIYGYPKELAAETAVHEVLDFLDKNQSIDFMTFVCFDVENYHLYARILGN
ncbi:MAG TPA: O-acetyl-ADP-ribose deacetylase [Bacteroidetes bacterium]|nr:O-acetyl-ADP-ribose deacetylase [Bacteroidota bacterium]